MFASPISWYLFINKVILLDKLLHNYKYEHHAPYAQNCHRPLINTNKINRQSLSIPKIKKQNVVNLSKSNLNFLISESKV